MFVESSIITREFREEQIPILENGEFVGSLSDNHLYAALIEQPEIKNESVFKLMQAPFPFVSPQSTLEDISGLINRENDAVLVRDMLSEVHIITKYDIIEALG